MVSIDYIEDRIAELHKEGKPTRVIAADVHKNLTFVGSVLMLPKLGFSIFEKGNSTIHDSLVEVVSSMDGGLSTIEELEEYELLNTSVDDNGDEVPASQGSKEAIQTPQGRLGEPIESVDLPN